MEDENTVPVFIVLLVIVEFPSALAEGLICRPPAVEPSCNVTRDVVKVLSVDKFASATVNCVAPGELAGGLVAVDKTTLETEECIPLEVVGVLPELLAGGLAGRVVTVLDGSTVLPPLLD